MNDTDEIEVTKSDSNEIQRILSFWFGETGAASPTAADRKRWYGGGDTLDAEIEKNFAYLLDLDLRSWKQSAAGILAYVILHDQFPLNIYRRQAKAYAFEARAEQATLEAIDNNYDRDMAYGEQVFLYMPLMHSEQLHLQDLGLEKFQALADRVDEHLRDAAAGNIKFAREHRDTVARFGRFPFRNQVLGRQSTPDEKAYLDGGAPRYGQ